MAGKSKFHWTAESAALLGTMPDRHIAQKLGITPVMVAYQRKRLGIKQYAAPSTWAAENDHLLGTKTDAVLAKELGVPKHVVLKRRCALKIPAFGPSGWPAWPKEQAQLLGTMPDAELAQQIGRSVSAVRQQRLALGIKACRGYPGAIAITSIMSITEEQLSRTGITPGAIVTPEMIENLRKILKERDSKIGELSDGLLHYTGHLTDIARMLMHDESELPPIFGRIKPEIKALQSRVESLREEITRIDELHNHMAQASKDMGIDWRKIVDTAWEKMI